MYCLTTLVSWFPPSFIGASCSVVDDEEEEISLTVAKMSCEMEGVEGVKTGRQGRGKGRGTGKGRGRGRGKGVVRVEERSPGAGRKRGKRRERSSPLLVPQQPGSPAHLGEYWSQSLYNVHTCIYICIYIQ